MRKQFAIALVAILLLSVPVIVPTAILASENGYTYFRFTGTVTELWHESYDGADGTYAFPVGDLDGDGGEDVLVLTSAYNETANTETKRVIAKQGYNGETLWWVYETGAGPSLSANAAGDLDGDGRADVLVHSATAEILTAKRGYDGEQLWEESVTGTGSSLSAKAAGDLDGDGRADVLVYYNKYDEFSDTTKGTVIAKRGYDGRHLWAESVTGGTGDMLSVEAIASAYRAGDLDGDGKEDVLVQLSEYNDDTGEITAKVIAKRGYDGKQLWEKRATNTGASLSAKAAGDLDGDGRGDVLLKVSTEEFDWATSSYSGPSSVIAIQGYDGEQLWAESVTGTESYLSAGPVGDLDGDGKDDVIVLMRTNELDIATGTSTTTAMAIAKRGCTGTQLWYESVTGTVSSYISAFPVGDLDGDGNGDVLVEMSMGELDTTTTTVIAKRGRDGAELWEESLSETADTLTNFEPYFPALVAEGGHYWFYAADTCTYTYIPAGDLNGDGKADILMQMSTSEFDMVTGLTTTTTTVIAKRGDDGTQLWKAESDGTIWVSGPLGGSVPWDLFGLIGSGQMRGPADLNGDGTANVLLGPEDKVYAVCCM